MFTREWDPTEKPWMNPKLKASEVLSGALDFWGEHGERWVRGILGRSRDSGCLYGGLSAAAFGSADGCQFVNRQGEVQRRAFKKAEAYVLDELASRGYFNGIIPFNDLITRFISPTNEAIRTNTNGGFPLVHEVVCGALKRALVDEEREAPQRSEI